MFMTSPAPMRRVLAPDGTVLTLANLPSPDAQRWVASRKAIVVAAVRGGLLSMSEACARYRLTTEEFLSWQTQVDRNGLQGLRTTRLQEYRGTGRRMSFSDVFRRANPAIRLADASEVPVRSYSGPVYRAMRQGWSTLPQATGATTAP